MPSSETISAIRALQVLDSRGRPTLEVEIELNSGVRASAMVPSGASTGRHEAHELRDGLPNGTYGGLSVLKAAANVNDEINAAFRGWSVEDQASADKRLIEIDGTANKARLGANAVLGVSMAVARTAAVLKGEPLWKHLAADRPAAIPVPMINILSGGLHAGGQLEFQDFLVVPHGFATFAGALEAAVRIHNTTQRLLRDAGHVLTGVADEGGLGPRLASNREAIETLMRGIDAAGYKPGEQVSIALDVAASHFHHESAYELASEGRTLTEAEMIDLLAEWANAYPVVSIEDGLGEDAWTGWSALTERIGASCRLVGDDLFCTNLSRLERGIREQSANAVLVKMNQIGTLTETLEVVDRAREAGFAAVISARSGETEDSFLADLATASGAGQIKVGSITRSERLSKYNRLLKIEAEMDRAGGPAAFDASRSYLRSLGYAV